MKRLVPEGANLIPAHAKCVFRGVIFDVYQWQQELFDGSFTTFEMLRRNDAIAVIAIDDDGNIVTIDEEQPGGLLRKGGIPVGSSEPTDSTILSAAKREFEEETGLVFKNWRLINVRQPELKIEFFVNLFVACDLVTEKPQDLDPGEKITVRRTTFDHLKMTNPYHQASLKQFDTVDELRNFVRELPTTESSFTNTARYD